jgi:NAD(P)-dependent dehydrogenase (short-subunit alcohol dehydrogenase family)
MTSQAPLGSGFGAHTTAREVLGDRRLDGRIAIVTGGYAGVGLVTTRVLAEAGATVIVAGRDLDKARRALGDLAVETAQLDLADPRSVDRFVADFLAFRRPLHLLVNNAGIMAVPLARDGRGFESQLATNHLGHFQLTHGLWPALVRAGGARVIALSSRGHARSAFDFEDPNFERRAYDKWIAYGQSKTANALFAMTLDARGQAAGVRAFAVHPGAIVETDLGRSLSPEEAAAVVASASKLGGFKSVEAGAATTIWCAVSPQLDGMGGVYCEDADIAVAVPADTKTPLGVRPWARDPEAAERLWRLSEQWTGARL